MKNPIWSTKLHYTHINTTTLTVWDPESCFKLYCGSQSQRTAPTCELSVRHSRCTSWNSVLHEIQSLPEWLAFITQDATCLNVSPKEWERRTGYTDLWGWIILKSQRHCMRICSYSKHLTEVPPPKQPVLLQLRGNEIQFFNCRVSFPELLV